MLSIRMLATGAEPHNKTQRRQFGAPHRHSGRRWFMGSSDVIQYWHRFWRRPESWPRQWIAGVLYWGWAIKWNVTLWRQVCWGEVGGIGYFTYLVLHLTPSTPAVPNCCCSKGSAPYWSNPPFLIFDIRALWRSVLSARAPECQKLKMMG